MAQNKKIQELFSGSNTKGFRTILKSLFVILLLLILICIVKTYIECNSNQTTKRTGYLPDKEDWNNIPIIIPPFKDKDLDSLPKKVSLEQFFPPIGQQGDYGTCVAWAVGYNLKTALNAIDKHWTREQLDSSVYQTSPKDLWLSIPRSAKSLDEKQRCSGTGFEVAFTALISDGVASMQAVPYENLGTACNGMKTGDSINKLASFGYIRVDSALVPNIKAYLDAGTPLAFSADIGYKFSAWSDSTVINSDTHFSPAKYHAMVLVGYDDSKNAFRVRNSWGKGWGDEGSIWVDYQFFSNDFCKAVFVAQNKLDKPSGKSSEGKNHVSKE